GSRVSLFRKQRCEGLNAALYLSPASSEACASVSWQLVCPCGTGPGSQEPRPQHRRPAIDISIFRRLRRTSRPDAIVHVSEAGVSEGRAQSPDQIASPIADRFVADLD